MEILFPLFLFPFPLSLKSNSFFQPISSIGPVATGVAHAREGLMTHLMYNGVDTAFLLGRRSGNEPE